jgi:hypothetical protein
MPFEFATGCRGGRGMLFGAGSRLRGRNENAQRRRHSDRYSYRYNSAKATVPAARSSLGHGARLIPGRTTLLDWFHSSVMSNPGRQKKLRWLKSEKNP